MPLQTRTVGGQELCPPDGAFGAGGRATLLGSNAHDLAATEREGRAGYNAKVQMLAKDRVLLKMEPRPRWLAVFEQLSFSICRRLSGGRSPGDLR